MQILKDTLGCDFVLSLPSERKNTKIKLLQITDMQIIDAEQRRRPDRLRPDEISAWSPSRFDENFGDHVRSLVATTSPDMIFITGDMVYGSFDDAGTTFEWFCSFMSSLGIPWAPTFGNHDNESARGVDWQCEMLERAENCLFKRGSVTGNSNYTVGISVGGELLRVMYMIDSNGCKAATDPAVTKEKGIFRDQIEWIASTAKAVDQTAGRAVPSFLAFHIPTNDFIDIEIAKGYRTEERTSYAIGVDVPSKDGDFGCCFEAHGNYTMKVDGFKEILDSANVDGVIVGHCHAINTVITYDNIRYIYGLKTGQYDYHNPYQLGGTLYTLEGDSFDVAHIPALIRCFGFPHGAKIFNDFFE